MSIYKNKKEKLLKEIKQNSPIYILLTAVLLIGFFLRIYRVGDHLGFYFDQGRDALVIWKLINDGKFFLIGPVTGLEGIFLGPLYYYLIAPFYFLGSGDPIYPAIFLSLLSTTGLLVLYYLGWKMHSRQTGLIATTIAAFSFNLVWASRWLSNPTPILLTSVLYLLSLWKITQKKNPYWWVLAAFLIGISMHFEAASAIFYFPTLLIFIIWQRKNIPSIKIILLSLLGLFLTFIPQLLFNFRHGNILLENVINTFLGGKSFRLDFWEVLVTRAEFYWEVYSSKILPNKKILVAVFSLISLASLVGWKKKRNDKDALILLSIFILTPLTGLILFQGNLGNIYDYYLTGIYLIFVLLFSLGLGVIWQNYSKVLVLVFFVIFLIFNIQSLYGRLNAGVGGEVNITLGNQLQSVDWIFKEASNKSEFNVDVYVPPVIPHAYNYLFLWQGTKRCGVNLCGMKVDTQVDSLYTLYEIDPPHPERLEAWLERQSGIGEVEKETNFGGITVQKRERI